MNLKAMTCTMSALYILAAIFSQAQERRDLFVDDGFDNPKANKNAIGDGWLSKTAVKSQEQKYQGDFSMKIPVLESAEKRVVEATLYPDTASFTAGMELDFSLYAMCTAKLGPSSRNAVIITFADVNWKKQLEVKVELPDAPTSEWTKVSKQITVPVGFQKNGKLKINIVVFINDKPITAGAMYIDNVELSLRTVAKPLEVSKVP